MIRGLFCGALIYVATLIIMPSSALGLTPPEMVIASVATGMGLALYVTRHR